MYKLVIVLKNFDDSHNELLFYFVVSFVDNKYFTLKCSLHCYSKYSSAFAEYSISFPDSRQCDDIIEYKADQTKASSVRPDEPYEDKLVCETFIIN